MQRFHVIEEGAVILRVKGGLYRQAKVYRRGQRVFAQFGAGFIRLMAGSGTTRTDVTWDGIEADGVTVDNRGCPSFPAGEPDPVLRAVGGR